MLLVQPAAAAVAVGLRSIHVPSLIAQLMIALVMLLCSGYILAIKAYNRFYRPTYAEKVQEFQLLFPDKLGHVACGHRVPQLSGRDVGDSARHTVAKR